MNRIEEAIHHIHKMERVQKDGIYKIHPVIKILVTLFYLICLLSIDKYELSLLLGMSFYPILIIVVNDLKAGVVLKRFWFVFLILFFLGLANPLFDRTILYKIGGFSVTGGMVSMVSLYIKGILALSGALLLYFTTGMEKICYGLRVLHVPKIIVTLMLLIYRYLILLMKETERILLAYRIRAPLQKGIHYKAWGALVGQLLLRSIDRAQIIYESMSLRGFNGEFIFVNKEKLKVYDLTFLFGWIGFFTLLRFTPLLERLGGLIIY